MFLMASYGLKIDKVENGERRLGFPRVAALGPAAVWAAGTLIPTMCSDKYESWSGLIKDLVHVSSIVELYCCNRLMIQY